MSHAFPAPDHAYTCHPNFQFSAGPIIRVGTDFYMVTKLDLAIYRDRLASCLRDIRTAQARAWGSPTRDDARRLAAGTRAVRKALRTGDPGLWPELAACAEPVPMQMAAE